MDSGTLFPPGGYNTNPGTECTGPSHPGCKDGPTFRSGGIHRTPAPPGSHWRHNVNGVDLNRDWGPFSQPETQSVARLLAEMKEQNVAPKLMLDFHSTRSSLFYTQMPDDFNETEDFATIWLNRSRERLQDFEFRHDPRPPSGQDNTKNYFFSRYGIPAITYEIGDEVDRQDIAETTPVFAEEMMRLMLER